MGNATLIRLYLSRVELKNLWCTEIFENWRSFSENIVRDEQGMLKRKIARFENIGQEKNVGLSH